MPEETQPRFDLELYLKQKGFSFLDNDTEVNSEIMQNALKIIWEVGSFFTRGNGITFKVPSIRLHKLGLLSEKAMKILQSHDSGNNIIMIEGIENKLKITETYLEDVIRYGTNKVRANELGEPETMYHRVFTQELVTMHRQKDGRITTQQAVRTINPFNLGIDISFTAEDISPGGGSFTSHLKDKLRQLENLPFSSLSVITPQMVNTTLALIMDGVGVKTATFLPNNYQKA